VISSHPAADLFPFMSDDELAELAVDIRAHGLLEPIVLLDGLVLDGRNRLRACEAAGVDTVRFSSLDLG
jgi:ParB-like chromosome segregation protein Spo0J